MNRLIQWWKARRRWRYVRTDCAEWTSRGKTLDVVSYHLFENGLGERKCKCFGLHPREHKHYQVVIYPWLKGAAIRVKPQLKVIS